MFISKDCSAARKNGVNAIYFFAIECCRRMRNPVEGSRKFVPKTEAHDWSGNLPIASTMLVNLVKIGYAGTYICTNIFLCVVFAPKEEYRAEF